jgi:hypothetical protein
MPAITLMYSILINFDGKQVQSGTLNCNMPESWFFTGFAPADDGWST